MKAKSFLSGWLNLDYTGGPVCKLISKILNIKGIIRKLLNRAAVNIP
jgi:hypothetical protein